MPRPRNSVDLLNRARAAKRRQRAEVLVALENGLLGIWDVLLLASTPEGEALRLIPVVTLLRSIPGWTHPMVRATITRLKERLSLPRDTPMRGVTVAMIVDKRSGGRRIQELADLISAYERPGLGKFPFQPVQSTYSEVAQWQSPT